ncbi:MAG TPA: hypothetical protein PKO06_14525 [Candidatus Ozemobacteraceae bacterium]|nr:hypothetical protein [Candidatus Ozemobacteraceae bacterium]
MRGLILKNVLFVLLALILVSPAFTHVLKTREGVKLYLKSSVSLKDTWLDLTGLSMPQLRHHPEVVKLLLSKGDERFLPGGAVLRSLYDLGLDMQEALEKLDGEVKVTETLGELKQLGATRARELRQKATKLLE